MNGPISISGSRRPRRGRREDAESVQWRKPVGEAQIQSGGAPWTGSGRPISGYSRADLPRGTAFSRLQGGPRKKKEVKEAKIEYLTPLDASAGNVFMAIEDKRMLPRPPKQKTLQIKRDMTKYCQYHKHHGHDRNDCRHLKIEIEKLIQRGQLKE
ncbi:hypothetical protein LIER_35402 [Lithospermum erythrorhizon]|uniref:Reverse transcriptase domain-containing protein n=1 Tax=Lithospermum erythrorhizon TaxID=34254 RepID=A0AAV3NR90_LITER